MDNKAYKALNNVSKEITQLFLELGIPQNLIGYNYLRVAVQKVVDDPSQSTSVCRVLYAEVAEVFGTTSSRVERAMRHTLEATWSRTDPDILDFYFGHTVSAGRGKPTNSEFICLVSNMIREGYDNPQAVVLKRRIQERREVLIDEILSTNYPDYAALLKTYKEVTKNA